MLRFRSIFYCALLTGLATGILHTGVQYVSTIPYVLEAEVYENQGQQQHSHAGADTHQATEPQGNGQRFFSTLIANFFIAMGFALILASLCNATTRLNLRRGLLIGLAGFGVFFLAPAWVSAPSLPGAIEPASLYHRQMLWLIAVLLSGLAAVMLSFATSVRWRIVGVVPFIAFLILSPRFNASYEIADLNQLAGGFFWASFISNAVFWLVLGVCISLLLPRFLPPTTGKNEFHRA